jgi:hypothetical protein
MVMAMAERCELVVLVDSPWSREEALILQRALPAVAGQVSLAGQRWPSAAAWRSSAG